MNGTPDPIDEISTADSNQPTTEPAPPASYAPRPASADDTPQDVEDDES